jgi:hypothetical protein
MSDTLKIALSGRTKEKETEEIPLQILRRYLSAFC